MATAQESIEDRLGNQFNPFPEDEQAPTGEEQQAQEADDEQAEVEASDSEEAEETASEQEETQLPYVEVEFNGKTYEVPEELKEALIQGSDYTRKTQDVARQHEAADMRADSLKLERENLEFEQSLSEERQTISLLDAQIKQYKQLDWSDLSVEQSLQYKMALDNLKEQKAEIEGSINSKRSQWADSRDRTIQEHMEKSSEWLRKAIPGWNQDMANQVAQDAIKIGFTEQEVNTITDPRAVRTLYESMKYRQLVAESSDAKRKASKAPPVVKPGSVKAMPQAVRDKLNFRKQKEKLAKSGATDQEKARLIQKRLEQTIGNL